MNIFFSLMGLIILTSFGEWGLRVLAYQELKTTSLPALIFFHVGAVTLTLFILPKLYCLTLFL